MLYAPAGNTPAVLLIYACIYALNPNMIIPAEKK